MSTEELNLTSTETPEANGLGVQGEGEPAEVTTETTKAEGQETDQPEEERRKKGGFQKRIEKLNAKIQQREALIEELLARQSQAKPEPEQPKQSLSGTPRPRVDDFTTYQEYEDALVDWKLDNRLEAETAKQREQHERQRAAEVEKTWQERETKFAVEHDDYEDVVDVEHMARHGQLSQPMAFALRSSENGPELLYQLAKHPEEAARIARLEPMAAVYELGRFEAAVTGKKQDTPKQAKTTSAPPPPTPIKGGAAATVSPEQLSDEEWWKSRNRRR